MFELILDELKKHDTPVSLTLLSQALQMEPSALEGMLTILARKGRIDVINTSKTMFQCHSCPIKEVCPPEQTWYQLADASQPTGHMKPQMTPDDPRYRTTRQD